MGDEKQTYFTIQLGGKAYRFTPLPDDDFERVIVVNNMGAGRVKVLKVMMHVLAKSAGEQQWDEITDRLIAGELSTAQVSHELFKTITDRMAKRKSARVKADAE